MALTTFSEVQAFFNDFIDANGVPIGIAPHGAFWQQVPGDVEASRDKFVNGNVPNVFGGSRKILVKGNSAESDIIRILKGEPPFASRRMPPGGPYFSDAQIQELADWIDGLETDEMDLLPDSWTKAPSSELCRLLMFDEIQINAGIVPDTYFLTVRGIAPCVNMTVRLIPYVYVRQPEYWQIEVVGCLEGGICLPVTKPYAVTIPLANIRGTKGIEVIGANRTERRDVPAPE